MSDHPNIEDLPDLLEGIPVREAIRQLFRDPANGMPDNISKAGCLALAHQGLQNVRRFRIQHYTSANLRWPRCSGVNGDLWRIVLFRAMRVECACLPIRTSMA